jgi:type I restriction enzyme S subunit
VIADLKPYAEYRDSGLPWLGQIPAHWRLIPNRALVRRRKVLVGKEHSRYQLLSLTKQGVIVRDVSTGKGKFSSDMGTSQQVRAGDLVFCLFDVPETPRTVGLSRHDGMITGAYSVFEHRGIGLPQYFELFYRAMDDRKLLSPLYSGLRNTIPAERFLGTKTPQPPLEEQTAIARFLDWANGRLERAIRAKRKVIALLNEQKQVIIRRAVTAERTSTRRQTANPWLGSVPAHWNLRALWTLCHQRTERNPGGLPLLSVFLDRGVIRYEEGGGQVHAPSLDLSSYQVVRTGDFVFNNQQAWRGSVGVSSHEGIISPAYLVLSLSEELDRTYANLLFRSSVMVDQFLAASKGVGDIQRQVSWPLLRYVQVPVPPLEEQRQIATSLQGAIAQQQAAIASLEAEVALIEELRRGTIAEVVTGKLDVRAAAQTVMNQSQGFEAVEAEDDDVAGRAAYQEDQIS